MNSDGGFDPYTGASSIDPYGGEHGEDIPAGMAGAGMQSWRTWRTKGAWDNWRILPKVYPFLRPYRRYYALVILLGIGGALIALATPWPLAWTLDSVLGNKPPPGVLQGIVGSNPNVYHLLIVIVLLGFGITLIGQALDVVSNYAGAKLEQNMVLDLRSRIFRHCENLSLTFHDERMTGQLMSVINMQASAIGAIVMAFPPIFQNALTLIGMLAIALLIDWQVTLVALVAIPLVYYATGLYGTRIVPRIRQVMTLEWRSLSIVFEAMSMLRVIVSFGRENYEHRRFTDQGRTAVDARVALTVRETLFSLGVTVATALGTSLVLGFGAWHVLNGSITTGELIVLIAYIAAVYQPLEQLGHEIGHMHSSLVFVNAAFGMLNQEPEVIEAENPVDLGRSRGEIELRNVSFAYESRVDTLKDITFKISPGGRVAIVGPTGAGKTTLTNLLVRFYDPHDGEIRLDGHDIKDVSLRSLRENIALVLQQPLLFSGTIAENIRYGKLDAPREEIIAAAKAANAHDFITALPDGYETVVGEGGSQLAGGERQRICVARAFIKDAPILILDEPTSSIDSKTEAIILDALEELMENRTSFMIAHRLSTILDADHILVVNHGELVEQGTHDELVARGGLYAQLYEAQTRQKRRRGQRGPSFDQLGTVVETPPDEVRERVAAALAQPPPEHPVEAGNGVPAGGNGQPAAAPNGGEPRVPEQAHSGGNGAHPGDGVEDRPERRRTPVKIASKRRDMHCDVCGRVLLRGEPVTAFLAPPANRRRRKEVGLDGPSALGPHLTDFRKIGKTDRKLACELCWIYAEEQGWSQLPGPGVPR